jgi:hypothetical protein
MMALYVLQTSLPLALILWLAMIPPHNRAGFWLLTLAAALMTLAAARLGIWVMPPWWVPYLMGLLLAGVIILHLVRSPPRPWLPEGVAGWLALILVSGAAGFAGMQGFAALQASRMPEGPSVDLAWPLGPGRYLVVNGGASAVINAHAALLDPALELHAGFGGSSYGVDLIAVDPWGLRAKGIMPADPARYLIFGVPVLSPCDGQVILAEDGHPDMPIPAMDTGHPAGNHALLRCNGIDILLGHFRKGSLRVARGESLTAGQEIAQVGNSGESSEPHLHIHAQRPSTNEAPFGGAPLPMRFDGRFLIRGDLVDKSAPKP